MNAFVLGLEIRLPKFMLPTACNEENTTKVKMILNHSRILNTFNFEDKKRMSTHSLLANGLSTYPIWIKEKDAFNEPIDRSKFL